MKTMKWEKAYENGAFRSLVRALLRKRTLRPVRGAGMKFLERKVRDAFANEDRSHCPMPVREDQADCVIALLRCVERNLDRGLISQHVLDRLFTVLLDNVFCNKDAVSRATERLGFGPPGFVLVSPGKRCNLHCTGCYACSNARSAAKLDWHTFDRILTEKEDLWGSRFTVISGGEPFMWEDNGRDLLDMAAKHSSNCFMVYTNGTLINKEVASRLEELGNVTLAISVEGFEAETDQRRGKGVYRRILRAFDNLREVGVPFGISVTATKHNWDMVTSDQFADFYFLDQGATYAWIFQYMPIGRKHTLDLMVTPEQRLEMLTRTWRMVRERGLFVADFWNSGVASKGCIAAGRPGGYCYIDWDGDVTPCAFVPYAAANINDVYRAGGNLDSILASPFFQHIREWQDAYGYATSAEKTGNWLCPCVIRDHFDEFLKGARACDVRPIDPDAEAALADPDYHEGMVEYGERFGRLSAPVWRRKYGPQPCSGCPESQLAV